MVIHGNITRITQELLAQGLHTPGDPPQHRPAAIVKLNPQGLRAALQDVQELLPSDARETMTPRTKYRPLVENFDVVPMRKIAHDLVVVFARRVPQIFKRRVRKQHDPAERIEGAIPLHDPDAIGRIRLLQQDAEVKAGGASADADRVHSASAYSMVTGA